MPRYTKNYTFDLKNSYYFFGGRGGGGGGSGEIKEIITIFCP